MKYVPELDGVRALAVLLVVFFHAKVPGFRGGFLGVDVFFVLSGYLITLILLEEHGATQTISLKGFYIRRIKRLYPALLVFLAGYLLVGPVYWPKYKHHLRDAFYAVIYIHDYFMLMGWTTKVLRQMWSLSIEEHFYMIWPLILLLCLRFRQRNIILGLVILYLLETLWRYVCIEHINPGFVFHYKRFDSHSTGLILGCLLGFLRLRLAPWYGWVGLLMLGFGTYCFHYYWKVSITHGLTLAEGGAALVICARPGWLAWKPLPWLGRMSYGLYLWNYLFSRILLTMNVSWQVKLAGTLGLGLAMAVLSYYTIEALFRQRRSVQGQADQPGGPEVSARDDGPRA